MDIRLNQGGTRVNVAQQTFSGGPAGNEQRVQLIVAGGTLGLREGAANLEVRARDGFWRPIRVDDRMIANVPVMLDFTPPTLEILASTRYLSRGGGGLVAVRAKGAARVGVNVGDLFFPGFPAGPPDSGLHAVLYALPWNLAPNAPVTATAQDEAGNAVSRALAVDIRPRKFPIDTIEVSEQFLASKMPELLPERGQIPPDQLLHAFLIVNRDKRKEAEEMKRKLAQKSKPRPALRGRLHPAAQHEGVLQLRGDAHLPLQGRGRGHPGAPGLRPGVTEEQPDSRRQLGRGRLRGARSTSTATRWWSTTAGACRRSTATSPPSR